MKQLRAKVRVEAFTLIELLVVVVIIAVIAATLLPTGGGKERAKNAACMYNQKQIALGFIIWNDNNGGRFPWQVSMTNSGTMELITNGNVTSQFQVISNHAKVKSVFTCPADKARRGDYQTMSDQYVSYFISVDAATNTASTILTGDRNLQANGQSMKPGRFILAPTLDMGWTHELHLTGGVLAFADGHAEWTRTKNLNAIVQRQPLATSRLLVP